MAEKRLVTRICNKSDTSANWESNNPVLLKGELGVATDLNKVKIGDGTKTWTQLEYVGLSVEEVNNLITAAEDNIYTITVENENTTDAEAITSAIGGESAKNADMVIIMRPISTTGKTTYTSYVYDGDTSVWKAMDGNYSADNVYLSADITMAGNYDKVGNLTKLTNGTATFKTKGKTVAEAFMEIFTKVLQPTITAQPSVSLTASNNKAYEVGTSVTPTYSASLSAGSYTYGPNTGVTATAWEVTNNQSGEAQETKTTASGEFTAITVGDSTNYTITATATHSEGAIAKNNVGGNSDPEIKITSGTKSKTSAAITGYRSWFTYVGTDNTTTIDSAFVRKGTNKGAAGTSFNVNLTIPAGTKRVFVAIPASKGKSLSSVIDVDGMGLDVKGNFTTTTVSVEGANGYTAVDYDVFHVENAAGLKATTYKFTF